MDRLDCHHHLVEDGIAPQRPVEIGLGQAQQRVRQRDGDQDAGVKERTEASQLSPRLA